MTLLILLLAALTGNLATAQPMETDPVLRSAITINYPNGQTVWEAPSTVSLEWTTKNIPQDKNLKFYLVLDEMVVQELGTFQNLQEAGGVELGRWLKSADRYQVMAIELFPLNPNYTAKYATPFFTINKKPRPVVAPPEPEPVVEETVIEEAVVEEQVVEEAAVEEQVVDEAVVEEIEEPEPTVVQEIVKPKEVVVKKPAPKKVAPPKKVVKPRPKRSRIAREVSYVKELEMEDKAVTLTVWDHGEIDGDVISIYLNGKEILSKFQLSEVRHKIQLELDPTRPNELMVYAHNLGDLYPNTAAIWLSDGNRNNMVVLKSDLTKSEALRIQVKK